MMTVRVEIPVRLVVEPAMLQGDALGELEELVRAEIAKTWAEAQRTFRGDGHGHVPHLAGTSFDWQGPERRRFSEPARRGIEHRLRKVFAAVGATVLPADGGPVQPWIVHAPIPFRARFDKFADFARPWWKGAWLHELQATAGEHYADVVDGLAWVVDTTDTADREQLLNAVAGARRAPLGEGPFLLFKNRDGERKLRALDPHALRALPAMRTDAWIDFGKPDLDAGTRFVFCAVKVPLPSTRPIAEFSAPVSVPVLFADLLAANYPTADELEREAGAIDWPAFVELYAAWEVQVRLLPFVVQRPVFGDVMRRLALEELARIDGAKAPPFAHLFYATPEALAAFPDAVQRALTWRADLLAPAADEPTPWKTHSRGVLLQAVLPDLNARVLAAGMRSALVAEAAQLAHIVLEVEDSFWTGAHRLEAFEQFFRGWRAERPKPMMEVIWAELERRGAFAKLFEILLAHYALWGWMRVAVIANVTGTSFERRPEVRALVARMNAIIHDVFSQITWDPATNELVFVHGGARVTPGGANDTDIIGAVSPYFTQKATISQPTPETMGKLKAPTQKKLQELMLAMLCKPGESRTQQELIAEAVAAASKELKLDPKKDFTRIRAMFSYRVIRFDAHVVGGLPAPQLLVEPVQNIGDGAWEVTGPQRAMTLGELDAELTSIQVDHEVKALTVFLLAETFLLTAGYIVLAVPIAPIGVGITTAAVPSIGAGVAELVVMISIRELIYYFTTAEADRDLEGYLTQALFACVDVIGFRIGSGLAKALGVRLAARAITSGTLAAVSTRAILYVAKGLVISTAMGVTLVVEKFADDLLHLTHCHRWSSPLEYLETFGMGFAIGLVAEFVVVPALSVLGRAAIRALTKDPHVAAEVAELLAQHLPKDEIEPALEEGVDRLGEALANTFKPEQAGWVKQIVDAFRRKVRDVIEHVHALPEKGGFFPRLAAEYEARAVDELVEAVEQASNGSVRLTQAAKDALAGLVRTTTTTALNDIVKTLLESPRMRGFFNGNSKLAAELFEGAFREAPAELDALLGALEGRRELGSILAALRGMQPPAKAELAAVTRLAGQAPAALERFLAGAKEVEARALLRWFGAHPALEGRLSGELLELAGAHPDALPPLLPALDAQLARGSAIRPDVLRDLLGARIRIAEAGNAAQVAAFLDRMAALGDAERAFVLRNTVGRSPAEAERFLAEEREKLRKGAELLNRTREQIDTDILAGRQKSVRDDLKAIFRPRKGGPFEFTINASVLSRNAKELARMGRELEALNPDFIIGEERGGPWIADAATSDRPALNSKIVRLEKPERDMAAALQAKIREQMAPRLAANPNAKVTIAAVETFLSGSARNEMMRALTGVVDEFPNADVHLFWIREARGFEQSARGNVVLSSPVELRGVSPDIVEHSFEVPFIVGEDATKILSGATADPIVLFDDLGNVIDIIAPQSGESTRRLLLRLLREWRTR